MYRQNDEDFWQMVAVAAIASGRATAVVAARMADELVTIRKERWPEEQPDVSVHGQKK